MVTELKLRDGRRALAWSVLPGDREAIRVGYELLSPESRFHRFLTGVPHLTEPLLDHLVDDVDGVDHVALVLFVLDEDNFGMPAGVGRIIRYQDDPTCADVAVTVLDHWQGQGVATALLAALSRQRPVGVTTLRTTVAEDNPASLAMLKRLGPTTVTDGGAGRLDVVVQLPPAGTADVPADQDEVEPVG